LAVDVVVAKLQPSVERSAGIASRSTLLRRDTAGKCIELLREVVPKLARLAVIANAGAPGAMLEMQEVAKTARNPGFEAIPIEVRQAAEIFSSIESLKNRADALYVAVAWIVIINTIGDRPPSQLGLPSIERLLKKSN